MPNFPWLYCTRAYGTANHLVAIAKPAVAHATPVIYESIQVQPQTDLSMNNAKKQGHQTFYTWHDWVQLALMPPAIPQPHFPFMTSVPLNAVSLLHNNPMVCLHPLVAISLTFVLQVVPAG